VLTVVCAVVLVTAVLRLFDLRFASGDIYPPYSSLRADPLGTRILFESLAACDGIEVSRNYDALGEIASPERTTLLFLGGDTRLDAPMVEGETQMLQRFVLRGGRIVVTMRPMHGDIFPDEDPDEEPGDEAEEDEDSESEPEENGGDDSDADKPGECRGPTCKTGCVTTEDWLGVRADRLPMLAAGDEDPPMALLHPDAGVTSLPSRVSCHTRLTFPTNRLESEWRTLYTLEDQPVVVEKNMGRGTVVLSALSYFVSNEAMVAERHPALLAWLIGDRDTIVFDETHHGVMRRSGVAVLARAYGLHWAGLALLILGALFVWRNAAPLVPRVVASSGSSAADPAAVRGRDARSGMCNLLSHHIPSSAILGLCVDEWQRTCSRDGRGDEAILERVRERIREEEERPLTQRDFIEAHNDIRRILAEEHKETP